MSENKKMSFTMNHIIIIIIIVITVLYSSIIILNENKQKRYSNYRADEFRLIASSENSDLAPILEDFAKKNNINLTIDYAGTIDIMNKLNSGKQYDAVWASNSIWLYMLDKNVHIKNSKSTSINPVVFAIKKSKAKELGFMDKDVYTKDILDAIQNKKLKFNMSSVTQTNTGATAYLGFLTTLAGNPEILTKDYLQDETLRGKIKNLFEGVNRSSGSEEFLEKMFLKGDYEAVITYEASIININKKLEEQGKEPLYVIYTKDGVSISDSPFAYIDNSNKRKLEIFTKLQKYILSDEGQNKLVQKGRRVWFGGINANANKNIFNPKWGIDTNQYLVLVKYPSTAVIKDALILYQSELRKPIHIVFCLDYSGSMSGEGNHQLINSMQYILTEKEASKNLLQFSDKDKITVIAFDDTIMGEWSTNQGTNTQHLINNIVKTRIGGTTNIYLAAKKALQILSKEDMDIYNLSVILMTDGASNVGSFMDLEFEYKRISKDIPIYSIMFGNASSEQLQKIANLTNAKVFDGRIDLLKAFKEVRGYN